MKKILVVDVGGTHVKLMISPREARKFDSGPKLSPKRLIAGIREHSADWSYDAISIGFPAVIAKGKIAREPNNVGTGWMGLSFAKSFPKPVRMINDAAMQALGSYRRDRTLFLGLGTGLGSALMWDKFLLPLELNQLPYEGATLERALGNAALERLGEKRWRREVLFCVQQLKRALIADRVVIGGGNARFFDSLPEGFERGDNRLAYAGGRRLWEIDPKTKRPKWNVL